MIRTRKARPSDLDYIKDMDAKIFHWNWPLEFWETCKYQVTVAEVDGVPAGFVAYTDHLELPNFLASNVAWIVKIGVKENARGTGVGLALFDQVKQYAHFKDVGAVMALVPETAALATMNWFNGRGFKANGVVPNSFTECGDQIDGYLFDMKLKANVREPVYSI